VNDTGGDPACWSHVFDHDELVGSLADASDGQVAGGVVWSLPHGGGLDANVVRLAANGAIEQHVNDEVDVLLVVWSGAGELETDGRRIQLLPGTVALVPRWSRRAIVAHGAGLTYLSAHPARGPMVIGRPPASRSD